MTSEHDAHTQTITELPEKAQIQKAKIMQLVSLTNEATTRANYKEGKFKCEGYDDDRDCDNSFGEKVIFIYSVFYPGDGYDLLKDENVFPKAERKKHQQVKSLFWKHLQVYSRRAQLELIHAGLVWHHLLESPTPQTYYPSNRAVCRNLYTIFIERGNANEHVELERMGEVWKFIVDSMTEGGKLLKFNEITKSYIVAAAKNLQEHNTNAPLRKDRYLVLVNIEEYLTEQFGRELVVELMQSDCTYCSSDSSLKKIEHQISKLQTIGWELKARYIFLVCKYVLEDLGVLSEEDRMLVWDHRYSHVDMEEQSGRMYDMCVDEDNLANPILSAAERLLIQSERVYTLSKSSLVDLRFHKMRYWSYLRDWTPRRVQEALLQQVVELQQRNDELERLTAVKKQKVVEED